MTIKKWEIYWANVKFEDSSEIKRRPVLIINSSNALVVSLKMTSQCRGDIPPEYVVREWQEAGLPKPTYVRHDRVIQLKASDLDEKIGKLTERDQLLLSFRLIPF